MTLEQICQDAATNDIWEWSHSDLVEAVRMLAAAHRNRYGYDRTLHATKYLDVETDTHGEVVSVWFRCLQLPFRQTRVTAQRAAEMRQIRPPDALIAVEMA